MSTTYEVTVTFRVTKHERTVLGDEHFTPREAVSRVGGFLRQREVSLAMDANSIAVPGLDLAGEPFMVEEVS